MPRENKDRSVDRGFLEAVLPAERGRFEVEDPLQCYAFLWLLFDCCSCGRTEMFEDEDADYPGDRWIISAASRARRDGWSLAPWSSDGVLGGRLHCPECSRKQIDDNAG